ncbi:nucleolar protein 14 homolog [Diabrotica virgifera virgifera]|uniref:Nucleolar protein 14 homolog n=1 Tax=Diabrotica virgifera virgifera TaxID=50390 RepID=A0ABM5IBL4_DIAVI|nr:nucleolar protein 14 homolog [Diabrotica virgifera virgifera]
MVKVKNKKAVSSERVHVKKEPKKMNPFEVHVNREKLQVIGKKQKNDRGLPGVSRAKAIKKRKSTLLEEYKVQNKNNKFVDRRIGEKAHMDSEEKALARYTALKVKAHNRKSIFNLADDEILTHKGQTLNEIEKFDDPRSDDEDFDDSETKTGNLESNFIGEAHFGGGLFTNTGKEGAMTHKDLINQLIVESKKRKAEKQKLKEATLELTEKLDTEWKDLIPLVSQNNKNKEEVKKPPIDDYDKVMRELMFERRGTVSDRLKTEDEIAKEEKENLEQLEQERLRRMNENDEDEKPKQYHRSADDLDDGFVFDDVDDDGQDNILSYNTEGQSNVAVEANVNGTILKATKNQEDANSEVEEGENEEDEGSNEESETDAEDNLSDLKEEDSESEAEEDTTDNNVQNGDNDQEEDDVEENVDENLNNSTIDHKGSEKDSVKLLSTVVIDVRHTLNMGSNKKTDKFLDEDIPDIPFTFKLPEAYECLAETLEKYVGHEEIIIQRMVKCNHPSMSDKNKENLGLLFAYILQYINDLFSEDMNTKTMKNNFDIFKRLVPEIYDLTKLIPDSSHASVLEVIKEKFEEFKKTPKVFPGIEVLVFLKLVGVLFPTSDFRHQIVTPCYVFMEQILTKCRVKQRNDIAYGLFVSSLVLEYTALSKRYLPAVINFLSGLLHMAVPKTGVRLLKIPPPFKSTSTHLVLIENFSLEELPSMKLDATDFCEVEITAEYQVRALYNIGKLLEQFLDHYKLLSSHVEIFEKALKYLELIPLSSYPTIVQNSLKQLIDSLKRSKDERKLEYLVMESARPKALRLYEPRIQPVYDGKQHKNQSKEKAQFNKLMHKVKREKKGALREIRRDTAFLGRVKVNKQIQSDVERRDKVKRIYSDAAQQQSELNEIDRKKKRKH